MHFELKACSPWTNLAEIWLNCCQIANYKTVFANFNSSFHFKVIAYFPLAAEIISHPLIYLLVKIKRRYIPEI